MLAIWLDRLNLTPVLCIGGLAQSSFLASGLTCTVAMGSVRGLPGVDLVVTHGKDQNGSQIMVGQWVAEEEPLPSSRGTLNPMANAGSDFDLC